MTNGRIGSGLRRPRAANAHGPPRTTTRGTLSAFPHLLGRRTIRTFLHVVLLVSLHRNHLCSYYYDGTIDEARISNVAPSADWIKTEYNNQNYPSTLYYFDAL